MTLHQRLVIDVDLPTPPEGTLAGCAPGEYPVEAARAVLGALGGVKFAGLRIQAVSFGPRPHRTYAPCDQIDGARRIDPDTGEILQ